MPHKPFDEPVESAEVMEVIRVAFRRGEGVEGDPIRIVHRYYHKDGRPLAEYDPSPKRTPGE